MALTQYKFAEEVSIYSLRDRFAREWPFNMGQN